MAPSSHRRSARLLAIAALALGLGAGVVGIASAAGPTGSGDTGSTGSSNCPASNPPNTLTLMAGTPQTAQLGSPFTGNLQVALANTDGCPVTTSVAGTAVTFTAPASGASGSFSGSGTNVLTVGADSTGQAAATMFTANGTAGSYTVTASSEYGSVPFALANTAAGLPATITPLAPTSQSAPVDTEYAQPLSVRVLDADGAPVSGVSVNFALVAQGSSPSAAGGDPSAGATFDGGATEATVTTGSDGTATSPRLRANGVAGTITATASTMHVVEPASFTLDNLAGPALTLKPIGPTRRSATVGTSYAHRLQVELRSSSGSPVAGATVTFALGSGGGGAATGARATFAAGTAQATETTGAHGVATSPTFTAGDTAGTSTATATASGAPAPVRFTLRDRAGQPATITAGAAQNESKPAGTRFAIPLAVTVSDDHDNPVPGAPVTFSAPATGASGTFSVRSRPRTVTVRTGAHGVAVAPPLTANGLEGGYIVTARAGRARPAAFALVNEP